MPPDNQTRDDEQQVTTSHKPSMQDEKSASYASYDDDDDSNTANVTRSDTADAWFTLAMVFLVNVLLGLNWIAFSVFYIHFTDNFDAHKSVTGWIGSIQVGANQMFGVLLSPMVTLCGCRVTSLVGSFIVSLAMLFSFAAVEIWHLHVTYGLMAGIGLCMLYISNAVILQQKFRHNRALAAGIGMSGLSLGSTIGSPLTEWLIEHYGWRGALMIHSAIIAHCLVLTLLYKTPFETPTNDLRHAQTKSHAIQEAIRNNNNVRCNEIQTSHAPVPAKSDANSFLSHMCDFSLLRETPFTLFCLAYLLLMVNSSAFWYHIQSRAVFNGIPMQKASFLTSFLAFAIFISRLLFSVVANLQCSNTILMFTVGCFIGASASFLLTLTLNYAWMAFCAIIFGCHIGLSVTVITVSAVYLIDAERIARGQAFLNFAYGAAALVSTPFSGWLVDVSNNYNVPFWINGSMALGACALGFASYLTSRHKHYKDISIKI